MRVPYPFRHCYIIGGRLMAAVDQKYGLDKLFAAVKVAVYHIPPFFHL